MNIFKFMDYCIDANIYSVNIWNAEKGENVWNGYGNEIPDEYGNIEEFSFDIPAEMEITFNI